MLLASMKVNSTMLSIESLLLCVNACCAHFFIHPYLGAHVTLMSHAFWTKENNTDGNEVNSHYFSQYGCLFAFLVYLGIR
jgi:hypothetical protein